MSKHKHVSENEQHHPEQATATAEKETGKPSELQDKLMAAEKKAAEYWDRLVRMQAEMDNAKRRTKLDIENAHKYALDKFSAELLPIVDSLELCVSKATGNLDPYAASVVEGVNLTLKMFYAAMDKFGVQQVNPAGEMFDPEFQQAISMHYDPDVEPGQVISVLQKGYTLNGRLIRPALVVVSKPKE